MCDARRILGDDGDVESEPARVTPGLCGACAHARTVPSSTGSTYVLCRLSLSDPRFPRYPTLPVMRCAGWTALVS